MASAVGAPGMTVGPSIVAGVVLFTAALVAGVASADGLLPAVVVVAASRSVVVAG
jgi:hypothetical protein